MVYGRPGLGTGAAGYPLQLHLPPHDPSEPWSVYNQEEPSGQVIRRVFYNLQVGDKVKVVKRRRSRFAKEEVSWVRDDDYLITEKVGG